MNDCRNYYGIYEPSLIDAAIARVSRSLHLKATHTSLSDGLKSLSIMDWIQETPLGMSASACC